MRRIAIITAIGISAACLFACGNGGTAATEQKAETGTAILAENPTDNEKEVLAETFQESNRIMEGKLLDRHKEALQVLRDAKEFLENKHGGTFELVSYDISEENYRSDSILFKAEDGSDVTVLVTEDGFVDNYIHPEISHGYEELVLNALQDIDGVKLFVGFQGFNGKEEYCSAEEIAAGESRIMANSELYMPGDGTVETQDALINKVKQDLLDAKVYGSFYVTTYTGEWDDSKRSNHELPQEYITVAKPAEDEAAQEDTKEE